MGGYLIVATTVLSAVSAVRTIPAPTVQWLRLAPHPTAPRASRNFVTRTLLDWRLGKVIPCACMVVSELVTNAIMHAGTAIDLSVAWGLGTLRLAVRDSSPSLGSLLPQRQRSLETHGRGLSIVTGLSLGFGVLPTALLHGDVSGKPMGGLRVRTLDVAHDVKVYPGVRHGFMNDHDPADATLFLRFLARISGTKYDEEATRDARDRITSFFGLHLREEAPQGE